MADFPKNAIVSVPPGILKSEDCRVVVRLDKEYNDPNAIFEWYRERVVFAIVALKHIEDSDLLNSLKGIKVRFVLNDCEISKIGENRSVLGGLRPVFFIEVDDLLVKKINFISGFNFPIHLNPLCSQKYGESLDRALDFYLHNPLLKTPIEPFHTLLQTMSRSKGFDLWDIEYERIDTHYYIGEGDEVSLARRWIDVGLKFGDLSHSYDQLSNSEFYARMKNFKKYLFENKSECVYCSYFIPCGGYLRAVDPGWNCDHWKAIFKTLQVEVNNAREIFKKYGES